MRLLAADRLHPEVGLRAGWESAATTIDSVRGREVRGKAVLTVG